MVVTDLRPNLIKITKSTGYATLNPDAKDIRRVIAEDEEWNLSTIPLLKDLTIDHIVKNFKNNPILLSLNPRDKVSVLERISISIPLKITAHLIHDESYWKRCCLLKYKGFDVSMHNGSWKRMFFEKHLQHVIENFVPEQTELSVVDEAFDTCKTYVRKLLINQLLPPSKEVKKYEDILSETSAMSLSSESPVVDHFSFEGYLDKLPFLEELEIQYGVRGVGMNFEWSLYQFTLRDCTSLANCLRKCVNLSTLCLHECKIDDEKVRVLIKRLLNHPSLRKLDLSHNSISDRGTRGIAKLINNFCPKLEVVILRNNLIRVQGAKVLAWALQKTETLKELDLRLNRVEDEGGQAIMLSLIQNQSLRKLYLSSNDLSETTAAAFCQLLQENKVLQDVDLSGNRIGPDGGKQIEEGMECNNSMINLDLRLTDCGQESEYVIHRKIKMNKEKFRKSNNLSRHMPLV